MDKVVKPIVDILKTNFKDFVDVGENLKVYQKLKSTSNLNLPLEKDVNEFMNKLSVI